ncbi:hypothetical protein FDP08_12185 [Marinobacter panjinensis]|uniref:Uncharacterized protein n=1 Tax=Marinobacter panjinensis TaxID=2576384 RepID=A0A4U6R4P5_9GAMM|nr:hypothetical protein [Marinobacter panjinensis]MCR8914368.1 hypothetical protein [Marinobacter panjinensis]TKV68794.1 hypothetical protein FDP08_12185 [Marinobacter panjinensis]
MADPDPVSVPLIVRKIRLAYTRLRGKNIYSLGKSLGRYFDVPHPGHVILSGSGHSNGFAEEQFSLSPPLWSFRCSDPEKDPTQRSEIPP